MLTISTWARTGIATSRRTCGLFGTRSAIGDLKPRPFARLFVVLLRIVHDVYDVAATNVSFAPRAAYKTQPHRPSLPHRRRTGRIRLGVLGHTFRQSLFEHRSWALCGQPSPTCPPLGHPSPKSNPMSLCRRSGDAGKYPKQQNEDTLESQPSPHNTPSEAGRTLSKAIAHIEQEGTEMGSARTFIRW